MKQKLFILLLTVTFANVFAQVSDNPYSKISQSLFENEMISNRFLRDFVLIKTNTFKAKALRDMDQSLAKFDDNMSYIILHLPEDEDIQKDYMKLQNLWNVYRMNITNYKSTKYKFLINKTKLLDKLISKLKESILENHPAYNRNEKTTEAINRMVVNAKKIDQAFIVHLLQKRLNFADADDYFDVDFSDLRKNIKKISKHKFKIENAKDLISDLANYISAIEKITKNDAYKPKVLFSDVNSFSKKTFLLMKGFINTIND